MKHILSWVKAKIAIVTLVMVSAVVGGASTAVVLAAIPDSSGLVHGCYRSSGILASGALRVIDNASQGCNTNETPLSWDQDGWKGYGYIKADHTLDAARSKNVVSAVQSSVDETYHCLVMSPNPALISVTSMGAGATGVVRGADAESDALLDQVCEPSANAAVSSLGINGQIYFFFR